MRLNEQFNQLLKTKIDEGWQKTVCHAYMRGVASSSTHCGRKPSRQVLSEKTTILYCALCSSAAAAVAVGHPDESYYSLVALQAFCFPKCDFWGGLEGASKKNFLGSLSLAIFSGPLINYGIIWPLELKHNYGPTRTENSLACHIPASSVDYQKIYSSTAQTETGTVFLIILSIHYSLNNSGVVDKSSSLFTCILTT